MNKNNENNIPYYLVIFISGQSYKREGTISIRDFLYEVASYNGEESDLLRKGLKGCENDDIDGMVAMFNHFCHFQIKEVHIVEKIIYPNE